MKVTFKNFNVENIEYEKLNSRQKENFNFQKLASKLADYGFNCIRLSDDWCGADFIAYHIHGEFLKVQLKGRLTINRIYENKDIFIAFRELDQWYLYPHDEVMSILKNNVKYARSWSVNGGYSWPRLGENLKKIMADYKI